MRIKHFWKHLLLFAVANIGIYIWIQLAHGSVDFKTKDYHTNAHHYLEDQRIDRPNDFDLLRALGQYDSQFYLAIADRGYVEHPDELPRTDILRMAYAFAPLWPALIAATRLLIGNLELSAAIASYVTTLLAFASVYQLVARRYDKKLAAKVAWLMFIQPFSIFFRGYFSESLFISLFALTLLALSTRKWFTAAIASGLMTVTRFVGIAGTLVTGVVLLSQVYRRKLGIKRAALYLAMSLLPLFVFMVFCWQRTGDPLYFISVRSAWWRGDFPAPLSTLIAVLSLPTQKLHSTHSSIIDVLAILATGFLLVKSYRHLPRSWWYTSLIIWLMPIMTTDTMSAARYQVVQIPLFIYLTQMLNARRFTLLIGICALGLLATAVYFVSWAWLG